MPKKLIFITDKSFLQKDYDRMGCKYYLNNNVAIEVWSIHNIIHSKLNMNFLELNNVEIKSIISKNHFRIEINKIEKNTKFILMLYPDSNNQFVFEIISRLELNWSYLNLGNYPHSKYKLYQKIQLALLNPHILWNQIKIRFKSCFKTNKEKFIPNNIFSAGKISKNDSLNNFNDASKVICCNSFNYDKYLKFLKEEKNNKSNSVNEDYILYLDNYLPHHQDALLGNYSEKNCDIDIFYNEINNYFDYLEGLNKCKVKIAAYPTADYQKIGNLFKNREISYGNTIENVKYAKKILIHNSTSVSFAALYKKPIIFISSIHYSLGMRVSIEAMAKEFNQTPIDIGKNYRKKISEEIVISNKVYDNYIQNFIISNDINSTDKYSYEAIFKSLFNHN
tara:strand:+ start:8069 stop:9247 length:1179 start_codon:yes stop_codon:yes gene_type:complete